MTKTVRGREQRRRVGGWRSVEWKHPETVVDRRSGMIAGGRCTLPDCKCWRNLVLSSAARILCMTTAPSPLVVFKLGGSLLDWEKLPRLLARIPGFRPAAVPLIVVGGGEAADVVRRWDRLFLLGDERAHWLALESLALNEELLQVLWPKLRPVRSGPQILQAVRDQVPALLCAACFVRWAEASDAPPLPHDWRSTTDSIAAWTAQIARAEELVLLKSTDFPGGLSLQSAADAGLVDGWFPTAAARLGKITWINGRAPQPVEHLWISNDSRATS